MVPARTPAARSALPASARTLPEDVCLNHHFNCYGRHCSSSHRQSLGDEHHLDDMRALDVFAGTIDHVRIWHEEHVRLADAVAAGSYALMVC